MMLGSDGILIEKNSVHDLQTQLDAYCSTSNRSTRWNASVLGTVPFLFCGAREADPKWSLVIQRPSNPSFLHGGACFCGRVTIETIQARNYSSNSSQLRLLGGNRLWPLPHNTAKIKTTQGNNSEKAAQSTTLQSRTEEHMTLHSCPQHVRNDLLQLTSAPNRLRAKGKSQTLSGITLLFPLHLLLRPAA